MSPERIATLNVARCAKSSHWRKNLPTRTSYRRRPVPKQPSDIILKRAWAPAFAGVTSTDNNRRHPIPSWPRRLRTMCVGGTRRPSTATSNIFSVTRLPKRRRITWRRTPVPNCRGWPPVPSRRFATGRRGHDEVDGASEAWRETSIDAGRQLRGTALTYAFCGRRRRPPHTVVRLSP